MKNTNSAFTKTTRSITGLDQMLEVTVDHDANIPVYLKDGLQRHQIFIQEQRKNIEQLHALQFHMKQTGKICPKAWHWGRFYKTFHPMYESHWLSSWWETTDAEKMCRFEQQLKYLATQTIRFAEANNYLLSIEDRFWYFGRE